MKKKICRRWKDVLEIFGSFLEIFSCEKLKAMESHKEKLYKWEMWNEKKEDARLELYNILLAIAWQFELDQFNDLANTK
jgi:hypothetical protein